MDDYQVRIFTFSSDGKILATVSGDTIKLWQESTEPIIERQFHEDAYPHLKRLESLLATERWDDADSGTANVITSFSYQDLNAVDQLWLHYSKGRYGFSVQKQIWEDILGNEGRRMWMNGRPLKEFDELQFRVGWGTVEDHQHYHGYGGEYFTETWNKTTQAYYPRVVHRYEPFELFSNLRG